LPTHRIAAAQVKLESNVKAITALAMVRAVALRAARAASVQLNERYTGV
jgi:hypothetical protein